MYSWTPPVEFGYLELPIISNSIGFPLYLPLFYQSFTMGYLELGYLEHPATVSGTVSRYPWELARYGSI